MAGPLQNRRHEAFCREFAAGESFATAYVRAGFKNSPNARFNASRLRNTPECRRRIDELMQQFADAAAMKVEYLQAQLLPLLQASAQDLFDDDGRLKPIAELPREVAAAIKTVRFDRKTGEVVEIVLHDKIGVGTVLLRSTGHLKDEAAASVDRLTERIDCAVARRRALPATPRLVEDVG